MIHELFSSIITWYMGNVNYVTVTVLMTVESSFVPFPSEVIVPPAAWKAAQGELNVVLVVVFGTLGSMLGAVINYYLALVLGRPLVYRLADTKIAHLLLIDRRGVEKSEDFFRKYGKSSTFVGRLVPAIRQLISLPAGLARMNMGPFLLFTLLGSGIWNIILGALGYFLYRKKELLEQYYSQLSVAMVALAALFLAYHVVKILRKRKPVDH